LYLDPAYFHLDPGPAQQDLYRKTEPFLDFMRTHLVQLNAGMA